ncbi:5'-nucleotidase C-terminal domain-containing protein [Mangrovimonas sp. YM274]|uniref:5'-nucleotidase C-terminal domain-containing protein n=1 Tax=Mangrovimonas sp. YM274 TaxID=3070660 RepID=UPI0027DAF661|nr:5'-nucleotidase [Mangrovimonas sp. YM274]WMI67612.1 5'-nucleotidase [Mangrovimonas sp. YM274]
MNPKHLFFASILLTFFSCHQSQHLYKIEGKQIAITDSLSSNSEIDSFIAPYREHLNKSLDSVLCYSEDTYTKDDTNFNTAIGNFMADAIYEQSNPIFKKRTGKDIDFVMLNHGSIRSILSKGNITIRTAYELMPFENTIVVAELNGAQIKKLLNYLTLSSKAHPISKLKVSVDKDFNILSATIKDQPIDFNKTYYVLTNNYLYNGGDHMDFFKPNDSVYTLDYKVRNALLDYFIKKDTIRSTIDDRYIQVE